MSERNTARGRVRAFFGHWEWILVLLILGVYAFFSAELPGVYTFPNLLNQTRVYMVDVGFMALGMMPVLLLGDIDISVGSIAALSATVMAVAYNAGVPFPVAILLLLLVGMACGYVNGYLITRFKELYPMIITLSTLTLYRGIAYIILKDQSAGGFPQWFAKNLGYGSVSIGGLEVPLMLLCILAVFPFYAVWIHRTPSGRRIFATGTNIVAARYSGLKTDRIKLFIFIFNGLLAAVGGFFLTARTGSVKYTLANGYEMQAIAIAVLGGASTAGGKGSAIGILLSLVLMTCIKNGLMIAYNDAFILNLAIGVLLIAVVLVPNLTEKARGKRRGARHRAKQKSDHFPAGGSAEA